MPSHKRKQLRKLKKTMKRNVDKAKQKQDKQDKPLPNQDMLLKLMALMGNKPGVQPSMDPATFLQQQEKKAERDNEIRKMKLQEKQLKSDNAAANEQYKLDIARIERDDAERKLKNEQELLDINKQTKGVQGGIRNLNIQIEQAKHQIEMNTKHGDLEALRAKRDELKTQLRTLKSNINYLAKDALTAENMAIFKNANSKIEQFINALNGLERDIIYKRDTSRKRKLVEDRANELEMSLSELMHINQQLEFDKKQNEDTTKLGENRIKKVQDFIAKNNELKHEVAITNEAAANASYIINRDKDGKPIQVYDESLIRESVKPQDDPTVKYYKQICDNIVTSLNENVYGYGDNWHEMLYSNFFRYEPLVDDIKAEYLALPKSKKLTNENGKILETMDDVVKIYKEVYSKGNKAYTAAEAKYNDDEEHNEKIRNLPKYVRTEITEDDVAKLMKEYNDLLEQIEANKRKGKYHKDLVIEFENINNAINKLKAQIEASDSSEVSDELIKTIAQLNKKQDELKRELDVIDKQRKRVEKIQDDTADMMFSNSIDSKRLEDSSRSKQARQDAEDDAIRARVQAEQAKRLNEATKNTHKAEQDKRLLEVEREHYNSEQYQEVEDQITQEMTKKVKAEYDTKQLEKLANEEQNARQKLATTKVQAGLNQHMRESTGIGNATTMLTVVGDAYDGVLNRLNTAKENSKPYIAKLAADRERFDAFNEWMRGRGLRMFRDPDEIYNCVENEEHVNALRDFDKEYDEN